MRPIAQWLLLFCAFLLSIEAQAHHTAGHLASSSTFYNPFNDSSRPPRSFVDLFFSVDGLDEDLGEIFTTQISGEYALHPRFSIGARLPVISIHDRFLPQKTSIGDVALTLKTLLLKNKDWFLSAGLDTSFPTGKEADGLGAGEVMFSPFVTLGKNWKYLHGFLTLGSGIGSKTGRPTFDYSTGLNIPLIKGALPIDLFLAFQGNTYLSSDLFETGSSKAYLKPGLIFHIHSKLTATAGGKISILDTLKGKNGTLFARNSLLLLNDVKGGFIFDLNYSF
ncbi:MAG: hypothetical protein JNK65_07820 [Deltaproteobacteria bacterium]|nr:hypothetical protein [Deltaproteobacteria bacterium]